MANFRNLDGTQRDKFQLDSVNDGPLLKNDAGTLQVRTGDDVSLDILEGADPTTPQSFVTKTYLESTGELAGVVARRTTTQTAPTTYTDLNFDTTDVENDTAVLEHNNTNTDRVDIKETGLYLITYSIEVSPTGSPSAIAARVRINDTTVIPQSNGMIQEDNEDTSLTNAFIVELTSGDFVSFQYESSVGTETLKAGAVISIVRMRGSKGDVGATGAGANVLVAEEGTNIANTPHSRLNFIGTGVTATDAGSGTTNITISGGGSGDVTSSANITDNAIVRGDGGVKGVQDSNVLIDDSDVITGATCVEIVGSGASHRLRVRNNTASGELIQGLNTAGTEVFGVNLGGADQAILRVKEANGEVTLVAESGSVKIGETTGEINANYNLAVQGALAGGNGVLICAGEVEEDISLSIKDADGTFNIMEVHADNGQVVLGDTYLATKTANTNVYGIDNQHGAGDSADINTANGVYRIAGNPVMKGTFYQYEASEAISSKTGTGFTDKVLLTTPSLPSGVYRFGWTASIDGSGDCRAQVLVNGTQRDLSSIDSSTNDYNGFGGFFVTGTVSGVQTARIQYRAASGTAFIKQARLEVWSIS